MKMLQLKCTIMFKKKSLDVLTRQLEMAEERVSELEDRLIEIQSEEQKEI